ncbi:MAG: AAA family ATPase, partial [Streptosporangiaceae bacterium]
MSEPRNHPESGATAGEAVALVGRRHELRLLRQAVTLRRPVLLLGPPGVSKTTMLRALAGPAGHDRDGVHWVTGDEQLSAHVLVGTFDPSLVLREGYRAEHFWPGPLARAMRDGGILYIEELNRAPSGALNVLITALSEGYVDVAHLGQVHAAPGFMVVGSANPLDDVGTGRLSRGLLDRFLVLEVD